MHPEDIKASLRKRHTSLAAIAREMGLGNSTMTNVIKGLRSERVEREIAKRLGLPVHEVFPDRYPTPTGDEVA